MDTSVLFFILDLVTGLWLERQTDFDDKLKLDYQSKKIKYQNGSFVAVEKILLGENLFQSENLRENIWDKNSARGVILIWKNNKWNIQFDDENIIIAKKNIEPNEEIRMYIYPSRKEPLLFSAPNGFVYYLLMIFIVIWLLVLTWLLIATIIS